MKKIIDELINSSISGVDVYRYKNATWLIFTDETRWVVELTDEGTLWYNYKFFNDVFKYVSMTVGKEMEEYVIQWANEHFFKVSALRSIANNPEKDRCETEKVLENGIKVANDSSSKHRQIRAENLMGRIVKTIKPNVVFHGIDKSSMSYVPCSGNVTEIWRIVEEGIKNTYPDMIPNDYNWQDEFEADKVIERGVKI